MVGALIVVRRKERGLSQSQLAEITGLGQTYISRVERGEVEVPQRATLEKFGAALGITLPDFYRAAGMLESADTQIAEGQAEARTAFDDLIEILEADPELGPQLAEIKRTQTPNVYRGAIAALAEAWKSNGKMMLWTWRAANKVGSENKGN